MAGPARPDEATTDGGGDRRRSVGRRAWRLYAWGSRAHWISLLFASRADVAVSLAALGLIGGVGLSTGAAVYSRAGDPAARIAAAAHPVGDAATLFSIAGRDEAGRGAAFEIVVFDRSIAWVKGSTGDLERSGRVLTTRAVESEILAGGVRDRLADALEVIAVGAASHEGDLAAEVHRAGLRARQTAEWIRSVVPPATPILTLNLGQYRAPCAACETSGTSWQRPFVVVAVRDKEAGVDIAQALASAMSDKSNLPSAAAYSNFGLARFR